MILFKYSIAKKRFIKYIVFFIIAIILGLSVSLSGIALPIFIILLPFIIVALFFLYKYPKSGIYFIIIYSFLRAGVKRYLVYISDLPFGLLLDIVPILILTIIFIKGWKELSWKPARNHLTLLSLIWLLYTVFELFNPEIQSYKAWFFAMRGVALYMFLFIPVFFMLFTSYQDLLVFLKIWMIISLLASIKGIIQSIYGPDFAEQSWLIQKGAVTHIVNGKLRAFSFYQDAVQFGCSQAHTALVAGILIFKEKNPSNLLLYISTLFMGVIGMLLSGTRTAFFIIAPGFLVYLLISRNFKIFLVGALISFSAYYFLKHTYILHSNYHVRRIRTALKIEEDASFNARLNNQKKLKKYLETRPIGGGVGSTMTWGSKFSPNTFLGRFPPDSYFVQIWAEMGIVGLLLNIGILFFAFLYPIPILWYKIKDPQIKNIMYSFLAGIFGIYIASYGNFVLGSMPTHTIIIVSWVFLFSLRDVMRTKIQN